jgi:non-ribosomal peptide synthetase component F
VNQSIDLLLSALTRMPPDSLAAFCGSERLTYADLNQRSCRLASRLRDRGVGPEVLVALPVEKSLDSLVGMLAIWKAGGAFVPLDPLHPLPWLRAIVREAEPRFMLAGGRQSANFSAIEVPRVVIVDDDAPTSFVPVPRHPQTMAYCNFTSGTTGPPKGVVVNDCSLVDHCRRVCELLALAPGDRVLQATPLSVDAALQEILPALLVGATVVIPDTPLVPGADFMEFLAERLRRCSARYRLAMRHSAYSLSRNRGG